MRLTAPDYSRFAQTDHLRITYGGGEANVSAALAQMGLPAAHVTVFPDNDIGRAAMAFFGAAKVGTEYMLLRGERLGLYFMEVGGAIRPSRIIYDRYNSAFAHLEPAWFDWEKICAGAKWFHWTGITPAVSSAAAAAVAQAAKTAFDMGLTVSTDVNYRRNLWQWGQKAADIMPGLMQYCHVAVCTEADALDIFGIRSDGFEDMANQLMGRFPQLKMVLATRRDTISASHNRLTGLLFNGTHYVESPTIDIDPVIDRIGGGDAFMAGFIYGMEQYNDPSKALAFANAASALKHTIEGDFNRSTAAEVEQIVGGDVSGRLLR